MDANDFPEQFNKGQRTKDTGSPPRLDSREFAFTRGSILLYKEEVYQIVGAAIEVLNGLGHGLHEKPYENALVVEFGIRGIPLLQQQRFDVIYKAVKVSEYVLDLMVHGKIVVDVK